MTPGRFFSRFDVTFVAFAISVVNFPKLWGFGGAFAWMAVFNVLVWTWSFSSDVVKRVWR
jgi:hypothetical protein